MGRTLWGRWTAALLLAVMSACSSGDGDTASPPATSNEAPTADQLAADQTLRVHAFFAPPTFDPSLQADASSGGNALGRQYAEPLLKPKAELEAEKLDVMGAAAESHTVSPDGLTYTFKLRSDGRYNDGQPVRAADFVYGWRRLMDPRLTAPLGPLFANQVRGGAAVLALGARADGAAVDSALDQLGLRAVDDSTFQVTLAQVTPSFKWLATLHQSSPIRKDVVDRSGSDTWATKPETLITNGPFKLAEVGPNSLTLVPNSFYREKPILTRVVATYNIDRAPLWTKYLSDEIDISNGPPRASYDSARNDPQFKNQTLTYTTPSNNWVTFNTTKPPFDNAKVRLAFAQAIDRSAYAKVSSQALTPLSSLIPKGLPGYDPAAGAPQQFDPTKARATLESSGVDRAQLQGVKIVTSPMQESDAVFVQDQVKKNLGMELEIDSVADNPARNRRLNQGDFQASIGFVGHQATYPDPQDFFDSLLSTNAQNQGKWRNAEYDRLVRLADTTTDPATRLQLYGQAQRIAVEDAPAAFLGQLEPTFWIKPWVKGITRTAVDTAFWPGDFHSTKIWIAKH